MKVFLTTAYPYHPRVNCTTTYLQESSQIDPFKKHELVNSAAEADVIIFAEHHPSDYFKAVYNSETYKKYKQKCFLYHDHDHTITLMPTISPSIRAENYDPRFQQPFSYIYQIESNSYLESYKAGREKQYLFSFIGASRTNPIRKEILSLKFDCSFLLDTSNRNSWQLSEQDKDAYYNFYATKCFQSAFILCPAGVGPNSYRLYESLKIGIPPVIISDQWIPSAGPEWESFSIRIKESDVKRIPEILKEHQSEAEMMGRRARQAWLDWFDKDKQFHMLTEACSKLYDARQSVPVTTYTKQYLEFLQPFHMRNALRGFYKKRMKKYFLH